MKSNKDKKISLSVPTEKQADRMIENNIPPLFYSITPGKETINVVYFERAEKNLSLGLAGGIGHFFIPENWSVKKHGTCFWRVLFFFYSSTGR